MIDTFTRLFGPYPFEAYTVVVTDDDLEIPLEAQGLSAFGANFLTSDWDSVRLVAHELVPPVVRQQPHARSVAGHLAARGLRLLRRVDLVRGVRRSDRPRARARSTTRGSATSTRTSCSPTPGRS